MLSAESRLLNDLMGRSLRKEPTSRRGATQAAGRIRTVVRTDLPWTENRAFVGSAKPLRKALRIYCGRGSPQAARCSVSKRSSGSTLMWIAATGVGWFVFVTAFRPGGAPGHGRHGGDRRPVSYTHLTLPTIYSV